MQMIGPYNLHLMYKLLPTTSHTCSVKQTDLIIMPNATMTGPAWECKVLPPKRYISTALYASQPTAPISNASGRDRIIPFT